jgi:hypothetical protein
MVQTDALIGLDPAFQHVKEMLEGIVPGEADMQFGQGALPARNRDTDAVVCMNCLMNIKRGV